MRFRLTHSTEYAYRLPASESFAELRLWPQDSDTQTVLSRRLDVYPRVPVDAYDDYFGNRVEFFSIPYRHQKVKVSATAEVETRPGTPVGPSLEVAVGEAWQILNSQRRTTFDFLQPTPSVPLHEVLRPLDRSFFRPGDALGEALLELNHWIHTTFAYAPGTTEVTTPLAEVIAARRGVCQDFAHLMLSILRSARLPARYVSGYIEAYDPERSDPALVGAAASHAWVEVLLPGRIWWGLDPTNDKPAGERHVKVAVGRDYQDVAPMRGTYKGATDQKLEVMVSLRRKAGHDNTPPA